MSEKRKPMTIEEAVAMGREKFKAHVLKIFEEKNLWRLPYKNKEEWEKAQKDKKAV